MLNYMEKIALNNKAPNVEITSTRLVLKHGRGHHIVLSIN